MTGFHIAICLSRWATGHLLWIIISGAIIAAMIGIFDSGSGGLSVLRALHARAPQLDVVYFGDLANMPYGSKSQAELQELTANAIKILHDAGATQIVSACNSVSASVIRTNTGMDHIIEMVGPAVRAVAASGAQRIAVAATPATVESGMYQKEFAAGGIDARMIACPNLAAAIESGDLVVAQEKIDAVMQEAINAGADALLLACTHYPLMREMFGDAIKIIDPADAVAEEIVERCGIDGSSVLRFISSEESSNFMRRVEQLFTRNNCVPRIESVHAAATPKI